MLMTLDNFSWNAKLPDSLFSMTPPEGYTLTTPEAEASEQSLIDLLKVCSQDAAGRFPDALDDITVLNVIKAKYPDEFKIRTANMGESYGLARITGQARKDFKVCRVGLSFVKQVAARGKWHYAGKGIRLGDASAVVCWWQLPGATQFRVAYGDLTVREMAAGELPPVASDNPSD
jgi:hypothetical protein